MIRFICSLRLAVMAVALISLNSLNAATEVNFPTLIESYGDSAETSVAKKLIGRVQSDPFNAVATLLFLAAICHTFVAPKFRAVSHRFEKECEELEKQPTRSPQEESRRLKKLDQKKFLAVLFHYLGEVEVVFGIWLLPLGIAISLMKGLGVTKHYINNVNYTEPLFVVVIMAIAGSKPILAFAESALKRIAAMGKGSPAAWWMTILTVGPLMGSFITEPAAMTICALLLVEKFFKLSPSMNLRYATIGLLFVNISIGGTLTHFAAPPVVMVASKWNWDTLFMLQNFGFQAALAILISNTLAFLLFRRELLALRISNPETEAQNSTPSWLIACHLLFIGFVVFAAHYAALVILGFLFYLAFVVATQRNQDELNLKTPVLVGFFLAGLVIHGGCQQWWIEPVLTSLNPVQMLLGATALTAFNDNAAITYLASLVPGFSDAAKHAVVAGAVAGGGLTVIANAPNPAGQSILQSYFGEEGIDAGKLFLAASIPTAICVGIFLLG